MVATIPWIRPKKPIMAAAAYSAGRVSIRWRTIIQEIRNRPIMAYAGTSIERMPTWGSMTVAHAMIANTAPEYGAGSDRARRAL